MILQLTLLLGTLVHGRIPRITDDKPENLADGTHQQHYVSSEPLFSYIQRTNPKTFATTEKQPIAKRQLTCPFPHHENLQPVTPERMNGGWAMAPDRACMPGQYCPYACPPGMVSAQWDPSVKTYEYPGSMNGGLYCNLEGGLDKPFQEKPLCIPGTGAVSAQNTVGEVVTFCQTVMPGDEGQYIATEVMSEATLAVPDETNFAKSAAHYYINPPGVRKNDACTWATNQNNFGNWAPYVGGANTVASGETFTTLGWNPVYFEETSAYRNEMPKFGAKIECDGPGCNGLPCGIDPAVHGLNEVFSQGAPGAGGAHFCVVTVPRGVKARVVVFRSGGQPTAEQSAVQASVQVEAISSNDNSNVHSHIVQESISFQDNQGVAPVVNVEANAHGNAQAMNAAGAHESQTQFDEKAIAAAGAMPTSQPVNQVIEPELQKETQPQKAPEPIVNKALRHEQVKAFKLAEEQKKSRNPLAGEHHKGNSRPHVRKTIVVVPDRKAPDWDWVKSVDKVEKPTWFWKKPKPVAHNSKDESTERKMVYVPAMALNESAPEPTPEITIRPMDRPAHSSAAKNDFGYLSLLGSILFIILLQ